MKHHIFAIWLAGIALTLMVLFGCVGQKAAVKAVYEGEAMGYRGLIRVQVGMEGGIVSDIVVVESREDVGVGGAAMEELSDMVLLYNTTELDVIAGATKTSKGFLEAIERAILGE